MRELLLPTKSVPELINSGKEFKPNSHLTTILSKCNKISVELCPTGGNFDIEKLKKINPGFCSVTWLSSKNYASDKAESIPAIILSKKLISHGFEVLLHLTGRGLNESNGKTILDEIKKSGIRNILCLQGDKVQDKNLDSSTFPYAKDLVKFIKSNYEDHFCIGVAAYPECHPMAASFDEDVRFLKEKVDAGADFVVTQMTFDCTAFRNFHQKCLERNINVPVVAGIYVICGYEQLISMARICSVNIPDKISNFVEKHKKDTEVLRKYGLSVAAEFVKETKILGVTYHVFSLNNLDSVENLIEALEIFE